MGVCQEEIEECHSDQQECACTCVHIGAGESGRGIPTGLQNLQNAFISFLI